MELEYKSKSLRRICEDLAYCQKKYGLDMAKIIKRRINEIRSSKSVDFMMQHGIGRCHALKGKRNNQYAVDLVHPFRLVFEIREEHIVIAKIIEIVDYH